MQGHKITQQLRRYALLLEMVCQKSAMFLQQIWSLPGPVYTTASCMAIFSLTAGQSTGSSDERHERPLWQGQHHAARQQCRQQSVSSLTACRACLVPFAHAAVFFGDKHYCQRRDLELSAWQARGRHLTAQDVMAALIACRECIPSGALTLDIALGGGFPKGRIIEVGH